MDSISKWLKHQTNIHQLKNNDKGHKQKEEGHK